MLLSKLNSPKKVFWLVKYVASRLDERQDGDPIQQYLLEKTGQRTVPNVFVSKYYNHP